MYRCSAQEVARGRKKKYSEGKLYINGRFYFEHTMPFPTYYPSPSCSVAGFYILVLIPATEPASVRTAIPDPLLWICVRLARPSDT